MSRKLINRVRLTPREAKICQLRVQGYSQPQIAARLVMEQRTVYWYTNAIRAKLGATNTCTYCAFCILASPTSLGRIAKPVHPIGVGNTYAKSLTEL